MGGLSGPWPQHSVPATQDETPMWLREADEFLHRPAAPAKTPTWLREADELLHRPPARGARRSSAVCPSQHTATPPPHAAFDTASDTASEAETDAARRESTPQGSKGALPLATTECLLPKAAPPPPPPPLLPPSHSSPARPPDSPGSPPLSRASWGSEEEGSPLLSLSQTGRPAHSRTTAARWSDALRRDRADGGGGSEDEHGGGGDNRGAGGDRAGGSDRAAYDGGGEIGGGDGDGGACGDSARRMSSPSSVESWDSPSAIDAVQRGAARRGGRGGRQPLRQLGLLEIEPLAQRQPWRVEGHQATMLELSESEADALRWAMRRELAQPARAAIEHPTTGDGGGRWGEGSGDDDGNGGSEGEDGSEEGGGGGGTEGAALPRGGVMLHGRGWRPEAVLVALLAEEQVRGCSAGGAARAAAIGGQARALTLGHPPASTLSPSRTLIVCTASRVGEITSALARARLPHVRYEGSATRRRSALAGGCLVVVCVPLLSDQTPHALTQLRPAQKTPAQHTCWRAARARAPVRVRVHVCACVCVRVRT